MGGSLALFALAAMAAMDQQKRGAGSGEAESQGPDPIDLASLAAAIPEQPAPIAPSQPPGLGGLSGLAFQIPQQPQLLGTSPAAQAGATGFQPQMGVQTAQLGTAMESPIAASANSPQIAIQGPAVSAAAGGSLPAEAAAPLPAGDQIARPVAGGSPLPAQPPGANLEHELELSQARIKEIKARQASQKADQANAAAVELELLRDQRAQAATAQTQARRKAAGALIPPGASLPLKGALLIDLVNKLNRGGTPVVLQGRGGGGGGGAAQAPPGVTSKAISQIAGMTQLINTSRAKASSVSDPDQRQAIINLETEKLASLANLDPNNSDDEAMKEQFRVMISQPSNLPNLEVIRDDPRLGGLKKIIFDGGSPKEILDAYENAQPIFDTIADEENIAGGLSAQVEKTLDRIEKETGTRPTTMAELRAGNARFGTERVSDSGLATTGRSQQLLNTHKLQAEETAEEEEAERVKRESAILQARGAKQVERDFGTDEALAIITPSGDRRLSFDGGRTMIQDGGRVPVPQGSVPLKLAKQAGVGDLLGNSAKSTLDEQEIALRDFKGMSSNVQMLLSEEALSNPGRIASGINSMVNQVEGLAKLAGSAFELGEGENAVPATADQVRASANAETADLVQKIWGVGRTASDAARIVSAVQGLAFAASAAGGGGTGRAISDKDVVRWIKRIGGNQADPQIFANILRDVERDLFNAFENRHTVITRGVQGAPPFPEDLRELFQGTGAAAAPAPANPFKGMSQVDIENFGIENFRNLAPEQSLQMNERMDDLGM